MAHRFDKFTDRARRVLALAQQEAMRLGQSAITPEHLLLGLVREGDGVAAKVLANLGVDPEAVRAAVDARAPHGEQPVRDCVGMDPRTKHVLHLAVEEAKRLKHHYIGTEHLLLGLLRQGESVATDVLAGFHLNLDVARAETSYLLSRSGPAGREAKLKRYNLALPEDLFREVERLAEREHTTVLEVLRRFIKLGLLATRVQETPGAALLIREGDSEQRIVLL